MPNLPDIKAEKLAALGYTGALNDAEMQFWLNFDPASAVTIDAIDALQDTDGSKYIRIKTGVGDWTSDGTLTVFAIPHGANSLPVYANVAAVNSLATGTRFIDWNETDIIVTYDTPPAPGQISLEWIVLID